MAYDYMTERDGLFTEYGQRVFLQVRDKANTLLRTAGAFQAHNAFGAGDSWQMLACLDRMVELGELQEVVHAGPTVYAQHRVFVRGGGS